MNRATFLIFITAIYLILDFYAFHALSSIISHPKYLKVFKYVYWALSFAAVASVFYLFVNFTSVTLLPRSETVNLMIGFVFTMFVTKLLFALFLLLQDSARYLVGAYQYAKSLVLPTDVNDTFVPQRRQFITTTSTLLAGIPFFTLLYGITKGKYQYTVQKITLYFDELPKAFDGFKVVQISDVHAGSFDNKEKVKAGIDKINELNADIVCFTGDLVNVEKDEIDPYVDIFSEIQAKYGKFATLGNHDYYGSYDRQSVSAERSYFMDFFDKFKSMGFDLLNNEHRQIRIGSEQINIVGVENWGAGRWFPKKGDLDKATARVDNGFNILLSHDPTHWDEKVKNYIKKIHLTLSGHTHGFQFGFQMPGFQWSPAKYRYQKWLGLYEENDKYLYVNRGFGFLGFPGRVGMWPEITLIELKSTLV